ncbi:MAG: zinc ribbon domain-containing protein [Christensenellaceae bacterium]|nr:zinc ribbon domain-containing protein [Christensenellaceae bacterium]
MFCTQCGKQLADGARFCTFCGAMVAAQPSAPPAPHSPRAAGQKRRTRPGVLAACAIAFVVVAAAAAIPLASAAIKRANYEEAVSLMEGGQYEGAMAAFAALGSYEDAATLYESCENSLAYDRAAALMSAGSYEEAAEAFAALSGYEDAAARAEECLQAKSYVEATTLLAAEDYAKAYELFRPLGSYKDALLLAKDCQNALGYQEATAAMAAGDYSLAQELLEGLADQRVKDSEALLTLCRNIQGYAKAEEALAEGKFYTAFKLFRDLGDYEDAAGRADLCEQEYPDTGTLYRNENFKGSAVTLKIKTPKDDPRPTFLKIYTPQGELVASVFIRGGASPSIKLPANTYQIRSSYGELWFGPEEMFGDENATYQTLILEGSENYAFKSGYIYTLTLRDAVDGNAGTRNEDRGRF